MLKESQIKNWAAAVVQIAIEQNKVDEFITTARDIKLIFRENTALGEFLANTNIGFAYKEKLLKAAFLGKVDQNILNTMFLIVERKLAKDSKYIFKQIEHDLLEHKKIIKGFIYSIERLDQKIIKQIEEKFSNKLKHEVLLENIIKKELIAGIRVEIAGHKYDSSAQGKILDLKRKVLTNRK